MQALIISGLNLGVSGSTPYGIIMIRTGQTAIISLEVKSYISCKDILKSLQGHILVRISPKQSFWISMIQPKENIILNSQIQQGSLNIILILQAQVPLL